MAINNVLASEVYMLNARFSYYKRRWHNVGITLFNKGDLQNSFTNL